MLHAMRRLTSVQLPPRPGLPRGLLLVSVYAPLHTQPLERARFVSAMLAFTHADIPESVEKSIKAKLVILTDIEAIKAVFDAAIAGSKPAPHIDPRAVLRSIELGVRALELAQKGK